MSSSQKNIPLPPNALKYCPDYEQFDEDVRKDIKTRFREHITSRRKTLIQCVEPAINDIRDHRLRLQFNNHPTFIDNDEIINNAFNTIDNKINSWNGVQFSKQFKAQYAKTGETMDRKKFNTTAANHQDQTSWKVSGNKFFAPYIARSKQYLQNYCQCVININDTQRTEICKFACISYAVSLLNATVKFHRTKPKPMIRYKTLVKSEGIHIELEQLYNKLQIRSFIACAKKKRKAADSKTTIKSQEFHATLLACCNTLYREQKEKVYKLFGVFESMSIDSTDDDLKNDRPNIWPEDLQDSNVDNDDDSDTYKPYVSNSNNNSNSCSVSDDNNNSTRTFQQIDPHQYGVRDNMNSDLMIERRNYRENHRQRIRNNINNINNNSLEMNEDIMCERLAEENDRLRMEKALILEEIRAMDRHQYNGIPIVNYNYNYNPYSYSYINPMQIPITSQLPQISQMPSISNIEFEANMIVRQHSGGNNSLCSFDMSAMELPVSVGTNMIPTFDMNMDDIPNIPQ